jgi:carbohydrate kinase (thermoresistant glucokinase family)
MIVVVMGVSGSGKSTVGEALAQRLGWVFEDGDRLHPPENIAKMHSGQPLDDADRAPWLAAVAARIDRWRAAGDSAVITCSALKRRYRAVIVGNRPEVRLVFLYGTPELLAERLAHRTGHFMPATLLESQFAALEPPGVDEHPIAVSVAAPVDRIVRQIVAPLDPAGTIAGPRR